MSTALSQLLLAVPSHSGSRKQHPGGVSVKHHSRIGKEDGAMWDHTVKSDMGNKVSLYLPGDFIFVYVPQPLASALSPLIQAALKTPTSVRQPGSQGRRYMGDQVPNSALAYA